MEHPTTLNWVLSCEHAGNRIPDDYKSLFQGADDLLASHRGWDPGALELAKILTGKSNIQLYSFPYSRLFIETNRSLGHPNLFSEFTKQLPKSQKVEIIEQYYLHYRKRLADHIQQNIDSGKTTIHIGVHTFTPELNGKTRNFEIGFLYDPRRVLERNVCQTWKSNIIKFLPDLKIRMNQPYKGISDGLTTSCRNEFAPHQYLGIELEVNQKLASNDDTWSQFCHTMAECFESLRDHLTHENSKTQ